MIEGRDIGRVVAPDAEVKVFLAGRCGRAGAPTGERQPGVAAETLAADLRDRDERDAVNTQPADDAVLLDTTALDDRRGRRANRRLVERAMNRTDAIWAVGRPTIGSAVKLVAPLRVYGAERVPLEGGLVVASNHFSWIDPPVLGAAIPRTLYFMAKVEAHRVPGLGQLMRSFGAFSVRRGESDREAVRTMRQIVRDGHALGLFVEGTRQRSGRARARAAGRGDGRDQRGRPVICSAIYGSTVAPRATSSPCPSRGARPVASTGSRAAARATRRLRSEIEREIRKLWDWLGGVHELGRPRDATPPT